MLAELLHRLGLRREVVVPDEEVVENSTLAQLHQEVYARAVTADQSGEEVWHLAAGAGVPIELLQVRLQDVGLDGRDFQDTSGFERDMVVLVTALQDPSKYGRTRNIVHVWYWHEGLSTEELEVYQALRRDGTKSAEAVALALAVA